MQMHYVTLYSPAEFKMRKGREEVEEEDSDGDDFFDAGEHQENSFLLIHA
jgi:hypothetical protein